VLAVVAPAQARQPSETVFEFPGKIHGKLHTDGTLTVGQPETLTITKLPGKFTLNADVQPPPTASECFNFNIDAFCEAEPLFAVGTGRTRFKSSRKGRATFTFTMPPGYEFTNFKDPLQSHPVYFVNGQTAHIEVDVTYVARRRGRLAEIISPADTVSAVVEVPPAG
jgi:hypothetical protein